MNYLYVDAGCLNAELNELAALTEEKAVPINYADFFGRFSADRVFYYDAWPTQRKNEPKNEFDERLRSKEEFFGKMNLTPRTRVRDGITRWRKGKEQVQEQKAVDVLLAVDVVSHARANASEQVTVLTSDLDFYPIFDALLDTRVRSHLVFRPGHTNEKLVEAADYASWLTKTRIVTSCSPDFANRYLPKFVAESRPLTDAERERAAFSVFGGHELAVWQDASGLYYCFYNNSRVHSPIKVLAIEHFVQGTLEKIQFSDGSSYP